MKPSVSPFSAARETSSMASLRHQRGTAAAPNLRFRHAGTAERRVGVERVGGDAVADLPRPAVEQVRRHDLEVVVRGVREGAAAVAVAERPDPRHGGAQLVVDLDVASVVYLDPGSRTCQGEVKTTEYIEVDDELGAIWALGDSCAARAPP